MNNSNRQIYGWIIVASLLTIIGLTFKSKLKTVLPNYYYYTVLYNTLCM